MGYAMYQENVDFCIKRENIPAALAAVKAMFVPDRKDEAKPRYAWVDEACADASTLEGALECWSIEVEHDEEGNIDSIMLQGEKLGDELHLFRTLAPFVEHASFIEVIGPDDNSRWRWVFMWGVCREEYPEIIWPYQANMAMQELVRASGEGTP